MRTEAQWRSELTAWQYAVLRRGATDPAGTGAFLGAGAPEGSAPGTFHCAACGAALFDARAKYDSGTGWPSFWQPVQPAAVACVPDNGVLRRRTEVRCRSCASHLGHVFPDGPGPAGERYCVNSTALRLRAGATEPPAPAD